MGVTEKSAPRQYRWLLKLADGRVTPVGALAPTPPPAGTMRAMEMLGAAMQQQVVVRLLTYADRMVRQEVCRDTTAEHFAGLAVATSAAHIVWPGSKAVYFSDTCPMARACLTACYPAATILERAEHVGRARRRSLRAFLLIAGFPCDLHSALARLAVWEQQLAALQTLYAALAPLCWGADAPTVVLLENTPGILAGVFDVCCAGLLARFPAYYWMVGTACPSLHADAPTSRHRVYWLAVRRDQLSPREAWPTLEGGELSDALRPIPLRRGLAIEDGARRA